MKTIQRTFLLASAALGLLSQVVPASTFPYQGLATEATGKPKADSTYSVVFALYGKSSFDPGNNAIWWETQPLTTRKGLFSVLLGTQTAMPDSVFHRDSLFLKVQFPGEIGFFVPLQATPWAVYARTVHGFDSLAAVVKANNDSLVALNSRVARLLSLFVGVTRVADSLYFDHVNLNVRSGLGRTDSANGLGNLIVGYNELRTKTVPSDTSDHRTGSHNVVIGTGNSYTSFGGVVAGNRNTTTGKYASVTGGGGNLAAGYSASVSGGLNDTASGDGSSVSGGQFNRAPGVSGSVSGGAGNTASGDHSAAAGGISNTASSSYSTVSGGFSNKATASASTVLGGESNTASGYAATVRGGTGTTTSTTDGIGP